VIVRALRVDPNSGLLLSVVRLGDGAEIVAAPPLLAVVEAPEAAAGEYLTVAGALPASLLAAEASHLLHLGEVEEAIFERSVSTGRA
jgi:hypothetical protein